MLSSTELRMSIFTIKGYICSIGEDKFVVYAYNNEKVRRIVKNYGEMNFVPLMGKDRIKLKFGKLKSIARIYNKTPAEYLTDYIGPNCRIKVKPKKNRFKTDGGGWSTSLSLITQEIMIDASIVAELRDTHFI